MSVSVVHLSGQYAVSSPDIVWQFFDDELILIHLGTGVYYSVTQGGAAIWRLMEAGYTPREVASHAPDEAAVLRFWQKLLDEALISEISAPDGQRSADLPPAAELAEPRIEAYKDMQDLFLLDPIHDVNEAGWPSYRTPPGN